MGQQQFLCFGGSLAASQPLDQAIAFDLLFDADFHLSHRQVALHETDFLVTEVGSGAVEMMRSIKRALDPKNIMNPESFFRGKRSGRSEVSNLWNQNN